MLCGKVNHTKQQWKRYTGIHCDLHRFTVKKHSMHIVLGIHVCEKQKKKKKKTLTKTGVREWEREKRQRKANEKRNAKRNQGERIRRTQSHNAKRKFPNVQNGRIKWSCLEEQIMCALHRNSERKTIRKSQTTLYCYAYLCFERMNKCTLQILQRQYLCRHTKIAR